MTEPLTGEARLVAFWAVRDALHRMVHLLRDLKDEPLDDEAGEPPWVLNTWTEVAWLIEAFDALEPARSEGAPTAVFLASRCHAGTITLCHRPLDADSVALLLGEATRRELALKVEHEQRTAAAS